MIKSFFFCYLDQPINFSVQNSVHTTHTRCTQDHSKRKVIDFSNTYDIRRISPDTSSPKNSKVNKNQTSHYDVMGVNEPEYRHYKFVNSEYHGRDHLLMNEYNITTPDVHNDYIDKKHIMGDSKNQSSGIDVRYDLYTSTTIIYEEMMLNILLNYGGKYIAKVSMGLKLSRFISILL